MKNDETMNFSPEDIQSTKGLAILSYLSILLIVPLLVNKDSAFTKFHCNQGLVLAILSILGGIAIGIARAILHNIPLIGWIVSSLLGLIPLLFLALAIIGIINAAQGQAKRLPVIGNIEILK